MVQPKDGQQLIDDLEDRIDRPVHPSYPIRDKEIVGVWRKRVVEALYALAANKKLEVPDSQGRPLYESLIAIADGPIHAPFEDAPGRTILLGEVIRNVAHPGRITQGLKGTCAATCVEIQVAERDPGEYARLCAGLVSESGRVKMRSGDVLVRDEEVLAPDEHEFRRSPISRIMQVAFMEYAYPDLDYRNAEDGHFEGVKSTGTGLSLGAFEHLLEAITGQHWETLSDAHAKFAAIFAKFGVKVKDLHRDAVSIIDSVTTKGETLFATLELPGVSSPVRRAAGCCSDEHGAHKIRVLGIDHEKNLVYYDDPMDPQQSWFRGVQTNIIDRYGRCSMSIEDFQKLLVELSYKPELLAGMGGAAQASKDPPSAPASA